MRKDLLIAESELNRAQLMNAWEAATDWHHTLSAGARIIGSVASAGTLLVTALRAFRRKPEPQSGGESSWLQRVLNAAGLLSSLCDAFHSPTATHRETKR
jgi:hypothetical protein